MNEQVQQVQLDAAVALYIRIRDMIEAGEKAYKEGKRELQDRKDRVEGILLKYLEDSNAKSVRTDAGTATISTTYKASLSDPAIFMDFVVNNKLFDLLDRRANSTAVKEYVEENQALPPGCNLSPHTSVNVRRPTKGSE